MASYYVELDYVTCLMNMLSETRKQRGNFMSLKVCCWSAETLCGQGAVPFYVTFVGLLCPFCIPYVSAHVSFVSLHVLFMGLLCLFYVPCLWICFSYYCHVER